MRLVSKPLPFPPNQCLVTQRADGELVDFDCDFIGVDPHVYLKRGVVEKAGVLCGMVPESEVKALQEQVASLGAEIDRLTQIVNASTQIVEAEQALQEAVDADHVHA